MGDNEEGEIPSLSGPESGSSDIQGEKRSRKNSTEVALHAMIEGHSLSQSRDELMRSNSLDWTDRPKEEEETVSFFKKYFANAQKLEEGHQDVNEKDVPWYVKYRRLISFSIPITIVYMCYFPYMIATNRWDLFTGETGAYGSPRYLVSITMIFGSMVAGATSEGGAAVAFPVLTLTMGTLPAVARDFSYLIQSVGMTSAAFSLWFMRVKLEWKSILYCTIGGVGGLILGLEEVAPKLTPPYSKMYFVSIWFAFAVSLYWVNHFYGGLVFDGIPHWEKGVLWKKVLVEDTGYSQLPKVEIALNWKACALIAAGFLGGIFTSMSGSGLDICSFAVLCLLFRVNERVATPTSVMLMAINTLIAALYREFGMQEVSAEAYNLWLVCIPIVVIGAPLGAILSSHFHRTVFAILIYIVDAVQFIGALVIIQPWLNIANGGKTDTPGDLCGSSAGILIAGAVWFTVLAFLGQLILSEENDLEEVVNKSTIDKLLADGRDVAAGDTNLKMADADADADAAADGGAGTMNSAV